jgi:hypothetical protein
MNEMNGITFDVIIKILYGQDVAAMTKKLIPYENPDGTTEHIILENFLVKLTRAYIGQYYHPLTS